MDMTAVLTFRSVVQYQCRTGYKFRQEFGKPLVTTKRLQCQATGRWDKDSEPGCSRKYWEKISKISLLPRYGTQGMTVELKWEYLAFGLKNVESETSQRAK